MVIDTVDDSYAQIVPYMIANKPVLVRTNDKSWVILSNCITELRNKSDFCNEYVCSVEISSKTDEEDEKKSENENSTGYAKKRVSMSLESFFKEIIDKRKEFIYLKDWHIDKLKDFQNLNFESTFVPEAFCDDWLNWYGKTVCILLTFLDDV
jgi:hypothetical protein